MFLFSRAFFSHLDVVGDQVHLIYSLTVIPKLNGEEDTTVISAV